MRQLEELLVARWPPVKWERTRQLIAVSGGADSIALLRCLFGVANSSEFIEVAHYNHHWRGEESDTDEQFVREICRRLGVRLTVGHALRDVPPSQRSEEKARHSRYQFLAETAYARGARYVLTAHTGSDRVETMLHNLFRGTGLAGLCSTQLTRPLDEELVLVRPLLDCTRRDVLFYLRQISQNYREDSSNQHTAYRRNFLRHDVLPHVRERYGPQLDERLLSLGELTTEVLETLRYYARAYLSDREQLEDFDVVNARLPSRTSFCFPACVLLPTPWPVVREALASVWLEEGWPLQGMTRAHWEEVRRMWESPSAVVDRLQTVSAAVSDQTPANTRFPAPEHSKRKMVFPGNLVLELSVGWICVFPQSDVRPSDV